MKALTIRQPWAWAIFHAGKDIENRVWQPRSLKPGETIAIHVAKKLDDDWERACNEITLYSAWDADQRIVPAGEHENPFAGMIIGLVDVVRWDHSDDHKVWPPWAQGNAFHWHLDNPRLIVPVLARGNFGLWDVLADLQGLQLLET